MFRLFIIFALALMMPGCTSLKEQMDNIQNAANAECAAIGGRTGNNPALECALKKQSMSRIGAYGDARVCTDPKDITNCK